MPVSHAQLENKIFPALALTTVTCAVADVVLPTMVAEIVTVAGTGVTEGAVYNPAELMVPMAELPPATPLIDQPAPADEF